ncbi:MAG: hypothetical protein HW404_2336, partial [Anaerolineales bacterium]|nr:hypothetical protein [Anaerolineales bacterium]
MGNDWVDLEPSQDLKQKKEKDCANEGGYHVADESTPNGNVEHAKEPSADEGSKDADENRADKA